MLEKTSGEKQRQVVKYLEEGKTMREIAIKMRMSDDTVRKIRNLYGLEPTGKKEYHKYVRWKQEWEIVTAALLGKLSKETARMFFKGQISYFEAKAWMTE